MKKIFTVLLASSCFSAIAASEPSEPSKRTPQGLYASSIEAYNMLKNDSKTVLVDIRTPSEWHFVGYTPMAKIMVPSTLWSHSSSDKDKIDTNKYIYSSQNNPNFISDFENAAEKIGANEDTTYILMGRSGVSRAQSVAKSLSEYGYKNVYIMTDGFEGRKVKVGITKGYRLQNGWKFNGLPWKYHLDKK